MFPQEVVNLLEENREYAFRIAKKYLHKPEDAEDAVQRAALKVLRFHDQFKNESKPRTWYTRIIIIECLLFMRRKRGGLRLVLESDLPVDADGCPSQIDCPASEFENPEAAYAFKEKRTRIVEEIKKLPKNFRTSLLRVATADRAVMGEGRKFSTAERIRVFRARKELKIALDKYKAYEV